MFTSVNLWALFGFTILLASLSFEGGFQLGKYRSRRAGKTKESSTGSIMGSTLGLLAFMLAFTFGMASAHFDARKRAVLADANAIRATYSMSELLPQSRQQRVKQLLREYVNIRLEAPRTWQNLRELGDRSEEIHDLLWAESMATEAKGAGTNDSWLFTQSLSEMVSEHYNRVAVGTKAMIPSSIWVALYLLLIFSMSSTGYHVGQIGSRSNFVFLNLAVAFSLILLLIADLDQPRQGLFNVSQQPILDLQNKLNADKL